MIDNDIIINLIFIITILLLFLYILKYYFKFHFIIKKEHFEDINKDKINNELKEVNNIINNNKEENNKKEDNNNNKEYILRNDNEKVNKRYYIKDNIFLNDTLASKKDEIKPSTLIIDQLLDKDLQRYYRYIYPKPIKDDNIMKKPYNNDNYNETFCKYDLHPLDIKNDDLSASLSKDADNYVLNNKINQ